MAKPNIGRERRRAERFPMELAVKVKAQQGAEEQCITKDLSAGGIFLYTDLDISAGSPVDLVMILPREITGGEKQWVCCHGQVVRTETNLAGDKHGIAVKVERLEFLPEITA